MKYNSNINYFWKKYIIISNFYHFESDLVFPFYEHLKEIYNLKAYSAVEYPYGNKEILLHNLTFKEKQTTAVYSNFEKKLSFYSILLSVNGQEKTKV